MATHDVLSHFTRKEMYELNLERTNYYCQLFVNKMKQGKEEFRMVFYGEGKRLCPLFKDAFHQAKEIMRATNSNNIYLDKIVLKTMDVSNWGSVIYPISTEQKKLLDAGVAYLLGVKESPTSSIPILHIFNIAARFWRGDVSLSPCNSQGE